MGLLFPASADGCGEAGTTVGFAVRADGLDWGGTVAVSAVGGGRVGWGETGLLPEGDKQADRNSDNANILVKSCRGAILNPICR